MALMNEIMRRVQEPFRTSEVPLADARILCAHIRELETKLSSIATLASPNTPTHALFVCRGREASKASVIS